MFPDRTLLEGGQGELIVDRFSLQIFGPFEKGLSFKRTPPAESYRRFHTPTSRLHALPRGLDGKSEGCDERHRVQSNG